MSADAAVPAVRTGPGRPTKLTPDAHDKLVKFVSGGAYFEVAAMAVGIGRRTLHDWLKRGEAAAALEDAGEPIPEGEAIFARLLADIREAAAKARALAEGLVLMKDPLRWLTRGPGKWLEDVRVWEAETKNVEVGGSLTIEAALSMRILAHAAKTAEFRVLPGVGESLPAIAGGGVQGALAAPEPVPPEPGGYDDEAEADEDFAELEDLAPPAPEEVDP